MLTLPFDLVCGYFDCSEFSGLTESPVRCATKFEIEFYLDDGRSTFADGVEYPIAKHHIQIARPGQMRYSQLPFRTLFLKFSCEGTLAEQLFSAPTYFRSSHPAALTQLFHELIEANETQTSELILYSRLLVLLDLILCDARIPTGQSDSGYEAVNNAKRFMETNFRDPIRLQEIAASVNLSPIYFHGLFTAACGLTPHEYLTRHRVHEAKKLLWDPTVTLAQIAEDCGFGSQQSFSKIFKQMTGFPPGKYRKKFQQTYMD